MRKNYRKQRVLVVNISVIKKRKGYSSMKILLDRCKDNGTN